MIRYRDTLRLSRRSLLIGAGTLILAGCGALPPIPVPDIDLTETPEPDPIIEEPDIPVWQWESNRIYVTERDVPNGDGWLSRPLNFARVFSGESPVARHSYLVLLERAYTIPADTITPFSHVLIRHMVGDPVTITLQGAWRLTGAHIQWQNVILMGI
jgi:hypothetical protein